MVQCFCIPLKTVRDQVSLWFDSGCTMSDLMTQFLQWRCEHMQTQEKTAWVCIWIISDTLHVCFLY
jgi:hypothetical protein